MPKRKIKYVGIPREKARELLIDHEIKKIGEIRNKVFDGLMDLDLFMSLRKAEKKLFYAKMILRRLEIEELVWQGKLHKYVFDMTGMIPDNLFDYMRNRLNLDNVPGWKLDRT